VSAEKKRRGRPKAINRAQVVGVAMETYWREGLYALSFNELCRRAEVSKPALYREFGSEDGLMEAALAQYRQVVVLPLLSIFAGEGSFAEKLKRVVTVMTEERGHPAGCLFTEMRVARRRPGPATWALVQDLVAERRAAFEACYQRALDAEEANPELSPAFAARYLDAQLTTLLVHMAIGEPRDEVRSQAQLALRMLLPPVRSR
jgi:AcrR family transcriptional regulator